MIVIDLERKGKNDYCEKEFVEYAGSGFENAVMLPRLLRVFEDHIEIDVSLEQWESSAPSTGKKTLKIHYNDAILMNRVLHKIYDKETQH